MGGESSACSTELFLIDRVAPESQLESNDPVFVRSLIKEEHNETSDHVHTTSDHRRGVCYQSGIVPLDQPPSVTPVTGELLRVLLAARIGLNDTHNHHTQHDHLDEQSNFVGNQDQKHTESELQSKTSNSPTDNNTTTGKNLSDKDKLARPVEFPRKTYVCDPCNFSSSDLSQWNIHLNEHPNTDNYTCPLCSIKFNTLSVLQCHIVAGHPGEEPWKCSICSFKTAYVQSLTAHQNGAHCNFYPYNIMELLNWSIDWSINRLIDRSIDWSINLILVVLSRMPIAENIVYVISCWNCDCFWSCCKRATQFYDC